MCLCVKKKKSVQYKYRPNQNNMNNRSTHIDFFNTRLFLIVTFKFYSLDYTVVATSLLGRMVSSTTVVVTSSIVQLRLILPCLDEWCHPVAATKVGLAGSQQYENAMNTLLNHHLFLQYLA